MMRALTAAKLAALWASACSPYVQTHAARVQLSIDGHAHGYATGHAQLDRQVPDGPLSIYLLPDPQATGQPYVCLRYYSGNPVGHLWVRHGPKASSAPSRLPTFECFVPGQLRDGTDTRTWKRADGSARDRTETGEPDCHASVLREGHTVRLRFRATLRGDSSGKGDGAADASTGQAAATHIRAQGEASIDMAGRVL